MGTEKKIDVLDSREKELIIPVEKFRSGALALEERIKAIPGAVIGDSGENPLKHSFGDGLYVREIFNPAHELIVTKIHKKAHPFFLLSGEMSIMTEDGPRRIKAPFYTITQPGTKRVIWTHTPCVVVTVHATQETDLDKIEEEIIAKDFEEMDLARAAEELKGVGL